MLRRWDSFDRFVTAELNRNGWVLGNGSCVISAGNGRHGTASLRCTTQSSAKITTAIAPALATHVIGHSFRFDTLFDSVDRIVFALMDGDTEQVSVRRNPGGTLSVCRVGTTLATGSKILAGGGTYFIEFKATIHNSTGSYELKINGVTELSASGVDTQNTANATAGAVQVGPATTGGAALEVWDYDDFYWCDTTGAQCNDFLGDVRIEAEVASGAGASAQWTPSAGSNFQNVDEVAPDDDTTYNSSNTVGQTDTYAFGNITPTTGVVKAVGVVLVARKDDAGVRTIAPVVRHSGADNVGNDMTLGVTYTVEKQAFELNPGTGVAFTIADVNAIEVGAKVVA